MLDLAEQSAVPKIIVIKLKNNFAKYVRDLLTKAGYDDVEVI